MMIVMSSSIVLCAVVVFSSANTEVQLVECPDEGVWINCPQEGEYLRPGSNKCVADLSNVQATTKECDLWSECGFCMTSSPFFEVVTAACPNECGVEVESDNCDNAPTECKELQAACELPLVTRVRLVPTNCEPFCKCLEKSKKHLTITPKSITSEECGKISVTDDRKRIVGGVISKKCRRPWQVSIRYGRIVRSHSCGGSLISKNIILSAAHCVRRRPLGLYSGVLGAYHKSQKDEGAIEVFFDEIFIHKDYSPRTMQNDIAIFRISKESTFSYSNCIRPICISQEPPSASEILEVTGWGATKSAKESNSVLREVNIPVISPGACNKLPYLTRGRIKKGMMCAGYSGGGKDACQGDSGGPAAVFHGGRYRLLGVVSWGFGCAGRNSPGVYADVYYYRQWIYDYMKNNPN